MKKSFLTLKEYQQLFMDQMIQNYQQNGTLTPTVHLIFEGGLMTGTLPQYFNSTPEYLNASAQKIKDACKNFDASGVFITFEDYPEGDVPPDTIYMFSSTSEYEELLWFSVDATTKTVIEGFRCNDKQSFEVFSGFINPEE